MCFFLLKRIDNHRIVETTKDRAIYIFLSLNEIRNGKCNNFLIRAAYNNLHGRRRGEERMEGGGEGRVRDEGRLWKMKLKIRESTFP